ncbi:MAG: class B sortase [Clostridia bacterium]|nr:class B sortase [Clostridia bacterium]MDD4386218.1 class B sortase [Clostridia bacterium]
MLDERNERNKKIVKIVVILIIIALITGGAYYLKEKISNKNVDITEEQLIGDINKEVIDSEGQGINLQEEILALNLQYPDAIAWLMVPGTSIDMPIFKSTDNNRYLRNDRDNATTKWGETFLDYRSDINNMDKMSHFIIYGHNTEVDSHFTPLLNFKNEKFLNEHKIIEMSTIKGNYKWEIFSAYTTDTDFFYIDTVFADLNDYGDFLNTLKSKSVFDTKVSVSSSDTILTLSTCDYVKTNGRYVVQAKLVK